MAQYSIILIIPVNIFLIEMFSYIKMIKVHGETDQTEEYKTESKNLFTCDSRNYLIFVCLLFYLFTVVDIFFLHLDFSLLGTLIF